MHTNTWLEKSPRAWPNWLTDTARVLAAPMNFLLWFFYVVQNLGCSQSHPSQERNDLHSQKCLLLHLQALGVRSCAIYCSHFILVLGFPTRERLFLIHTGSDRGKPRDTSSPSPRIAWKRAYSTAPTVLRTGWIAFLWNIAQRSHLWPGAPDNN